MRYTVYSNTNKRFMNKEKETNSLHEAIAYAKTLKGRNETWINDNYTGAICKA